jgi:hypothetical protein
MIHESNFKVQSKEGAKAKGMFLHTSSSNKKLIVTFPGMGYTCDMPVLYYFREVALQHRCDIFSIQYYFQHTEVPFDVKSDLQQVHDDCYNLILQAVKDISSYDSVIFLSKSIGTVIAGKTALRFGEIPINHFFLTPISGTIAFIEKAKCVAIVGTEDHYFKEGDIERIKNMPLATVETIDGANHSLEVELNYEKSLSVLSHLLKLWNDYIVSDEMEI